MTHNFKWDSKHTNDPKICECGEHRDHLDHGTVGESGIFRVVMAEEKLRSIPAGPRNPTGTGLRMDTINEVVYIRADRFTATDGGTLTFFIDNQPVKALAAGQWRDCHKVSKVRDNDDAVILRDGAVRHSA